MQRRVERIVMEVAKGKDDKKREVVLKEVRKAAVVVKQWPVDEQQCADVWFETC